MDTRVRVQNGRHTFEMGISAGLMAAAEELAKVPQNIHATPGFQLALAKVQALAAEQRANTVARNLAILAKAGVDIATHRAVSFDPMTDELICQFYAEQEPE